jgi:hypothetical protein
MGVPTAQLIIFSQLVDIYLKQYTRKDPSIFGRLKFWVDRFGEKSGTTIDEFMVSDGLVYLTKIINIVTPVESGLSRYYVRAKCNLREYVVFHQESKGQV